MFYLFQGRVKLEREVHQNMHQILMWNSCDQMLKEVIKHNHEHKRRKECSAHTSFGNYSRFQISL